MKVGSVHARLSAAWLGALAVCLITVQCSKPTSTSSPSSPTPATEQPPNTPHPPTTPPGPQTFVGAGDIAMCDPADQIGHQEDTAKLLDTIGGTVFTLGDNAYPNGSRENYRDCYDKSWGRHKDRTRPAPGNHEYRSAGAQFYYEYFGANAGPSGVGDYSYNVGGWHILSLNSEPSVPHPGQDSWIRDDLAANAGTKCTLAYWHHPLFSSSQNGNSPWMRGIYRVLYDANVDVVLSGHDHSYERFGPQDADGHPDATRGIREFVVGTGGTSLLYQFMAIQPNSEVRIANEFGVLKMTLNADSYGWEFITINHATRDSGLVACH